MSERKKRFRPAGGGMKPSESELGSFIRARRLALNLGQIALAEKAEIAQSYVSAIEIGSCKRLRDEHLEQLAKALQCDVKELRKRMPPVAEPTTKLGKLIRSQREKLGISLSLFAERAKMTLAQARELETRRHSVAYHLVRPLTTALGLDPSVLIPFVGTRAKETTSELGQRIRSRRKELGISAKGLAEALSLSRQFISLIELGKTSLVYSDDTIRCLAKILEMKPGELEAVRPKIPEKIVSPPPPRQANGRKLFTPERETPLGKRVTARRLELGLSQAELAQKAGASRAAVSEIECGKYRPGKKILGRISKALGLEVPMLVPTNAECGPER